MSAKAIILKPIDAKTSRLFVERVHYSHKAVNNSQLHIGVYWHGKLEGVMSFGPSLDKRKIVGLVNGTGWNEFIELNRMAFTDKLPRNSESRALSIAFKLIKKHAPHVKWIVTFADATQCGDGTIYRAAGFVLTGIKKNDQIWIAPDNVSVATRLVATDTRRPARQKLLTDTISRVTVTKGEHISETGAASMKAFKALGWRPLAGFQIRYIYFLDPAYRTRLTVPELPYSEIGRHAASMYKGKPASEVKTVDTSGIQPEKGGAAPTRTLEV